MTVDTTNPSYWLNWRFLLCAVWILVAMVCSSLIIWRNEGHNRSKNRTNENPQDTKRCLYKGQAWETCSVSINPIWLLAYRILAFCVMLSLILADTIVHSIGIFYYYTQWTFTLVIIYFGLGSSLSIYGCLQSCKKVDLESEGIQGIDRRSLNHDNNVTLKVASVWEHAFQIIFQMCAGAVVLTDAVFWLILYTFFTDKDFKLAFLVVCMHSVNAVFLLGDTFLNSLRFPFFRMAYFVLWTCVFVVFQWIFHMCVSTRWPYPFLDLSSSYAPAWYLAVGLLHLPCFGLFTLIFKIKQRCLSKMSSHSND